MSSSKLLVQDVEHKLLLEISTLSRSVLIGSDGPPASATSGWVEGVIGGRRWSITSFFLFIFTILHGLYPKNNSITPKQHFQLEAPVVLAASVFETLLI
ncbi:hypothetical protein O3G_MSEX013744 [Manduca sexta]|uniref:Uncharacterized protein n=1 Tax=Manduca sexta TaxID=7130 RepID=A0A922CYE4_MANSE|nr:hypothetical protein O3G_MSEX013744 [Manduca sexta]